MFSDVTRKNLRRNVRIGMGASKEQAYYLEHLFFEMDWILTDKEYKALDTLTYHCFCDPEVFNSLVYKIRQTWQ